MYHVVCFKCLLLKLVVRSATNVRACLHARCFMISSCCLITVRRGTLPSHTCSYSLRCRVTFLSLACLTSSVSYCSARVSSGSGSYLVRQGVMWVSRGTWGLLGHFEHQVVDELLSRWMTSHRNLSTVHLRAERSRRRSTHLTVHQRHLNTTQCNATAQHTD